MNGKVKYGICACGCSKEESPLYSRGFKQACYWRITNENAQLKRDSRATGQPREKKKTNIIPQRSKQGKKVDPPEFAKNKKKLRFEKLKEFGYLFCDKCNRSGSRYYEMHHIIFRSEKPKHKKLHDSINLIDLCVDCHNGFHDNKKSREYLVIERKLDAVFGLDVLFNSP